MTIVTTGDEEVPRGALQHPGGHLCGGGGPGHRGGGSDHLLRRQQESHQAGPEDGADRQETAGPNRDAGHSGQGGTGTVMRLV